jgi:CTP:molybdopterin cytidylyltransferase MocA
MGGPKALLRDPRGVPYVDRAIGSLLAGGCGSVTVVLGAAADDARVLLDEAGWSASPSVDTVVAAEWEQGMGASLRTGLVTLEDQPVDGALVSLVDLPDVDAAVVRRVLDLGAGALSLVRATYSGRPGHPVLIGREHWRGVASAAQGDQGARDYLDTHGAALCECGDLATGRDLDRPGDLRA